MAQKRLGPADTDFIMKLDDVGYSNSEIARKLGVTEGAICGRRRRIFRLFRSRRRGPG